MSKKRDLNTAEMDVAAKLNGTDKAKLVLMSSVNAASVITAYPNDIVGADVDLGALLNGLSESCSDVKEGHLSTLEAMLTGQAIALQTIFTSLARRAQKQEYQRNLEAFLTLALKAQAQSRATIQALVELKYPRQIAFVKQANISHGPQQVNNGEAHVPSRSRARKKQVAQNKLLEDQSDGSTYLDAGATAAAIRSDTAVEAVAEVNRAKK